MELDVLKEKIEDYGLLCFSGGSNEVQPFCWTCTNGCSTSNCSGGCSSGNCAGGCSQQCLSGCNSGGCSGGCSSSSCPSGCSSGCAAGCTRFVTLSDIPIIMT